MVAFSVHVFHFDRSTSRGMALYLAQVSARDFLGFPRNGDGFFGCCIRLSVWRYKEAVWPDTVQILGYKDLEGPLVDLEKISDPNLGPQISFGTK